MKFFKQLELGEPGTEIPLSEVVANLPWGNDGLLPVIAQDHESKEVLMLAWMNAEALAETLSTGRVCYWSRSRQSLWRKGETSGHTQQLKNIRFDCDGDAILCLVEQIGPACHTLRPNCFYLNVVDDHVIIES